MRFRDTFTGDAAADFLLGLLSTVGQIAEDTSHPSLEAGMDDYVVKPISIGDLRRVLQAVRVQRPMQVDAVGSCPVDVEGSR